MKRAKILVTGSTGFFGQQVVKALSLLEVELCIVVRPEKSNFFEQNTAVKSTVISNNVFAESASWWKKQCRDVDIFIHLAWYAEPGKYLDSNYNEQCFSGTKDMAKGAVEAGVERFIGIGTCFEYQFSESPLDTSSPLDPQTLYAKMKVNTFEYLSSYFQEHNVKFLWCRLFYLYGEGEDERRLVPVIRKNLSEGKIVELTSGDKVKDYMNIEEAGKIIANLAVNTHTGAYNVCSGKGTTIKALAENIADEYNNGRALLKFGQISRKSYDPPFIVGIKTDKNF
jgi:dTDP-6-deoxy-L-talose 4-dehydrogenase (NAD+)